MKNNDRNISVKEMIASGQAVVEREYWSRELSPDIAKSVFPMDYIPNGGNMNAIAVIERSLSSELVAALIKPTKGSDTKLFMILASGLVSLLHKYTDSSDIIVGVPIYKQDVDGEFINTIIPLRIRIEKEMTFKELLMQVRKKIIDGYNNQNFPIETLVYEMASSNTEDEFPLFDIALLLENIHDQAYIDHTRPAVCFNFLRTDDGIRLKLHYRTSLYTENTMTRMVDYYTYFMQQALAGIDQPIDQVDMISPGEKNRLFHDFNPSETEVTSKTITQAFEETVKKRASHIALAVWGMETNTWNGEPESVHLTYKQLNEKANAVARVLREKGVKPDTIVALLIEPSVEMVVGILAILKAGGAYLPIDTYTPPERVKIILSDSAAHFLVTKKQWATPLGFDKVLIDLTDENVYNGNTDNLDNINSPKDLAYVIYTSGSTGIPKGVLIEHRNIMNYAAWRLQAYDQTLEDNSLQLLSISFDGFCANFYPSLLSGGKLVLLNDSKTRDPDYTLKVIKEEQVTCFSLTPLLYKSVIEKAARGDLDSVKFVVIGGERAGRDVIRCSLDTAPNIRLINEYGPTENSVTTTANCDMTEENLSIVGTPISNNSIYILGKERELKPVCVPGELCVAGSGLARGYLNRPDLTAEKFIPNPHPRAGHEEPQVGDRLYCTGDTAMWRPEGTIQLTGRIDQQVKIRGYRVELEEIEVRLASHPNIDGAAVIAGGKGFENILYAFYVTAKDVETTDIRMFLFSTLPDYMVPHHFIRLEALPTTTRGKVDRKKIKKIAANMKSEVQYAAPRTENEKILVDIWKGVLKLEKVGINDNFFNIGGDSIKTLSLLSIVNKTFGTQFQVVDLYENETIEKVATLIEQNTSQQLDNQQEDNDVVKEIDDLKNKFLKGL